MTPQIWKLIIDALIVTAIVLLAITPILYWLTSQVRRHVEDAEENWTTVKEVVLDGYVYQTHNTTGKRRITKLLYPAPPTNKAWLKGETDEL